MDKQAANVGLIYSSVLLSLLGNPDRTFIGAEAVRPPVGSAWARQGTSNISHKIHKLAIC
jgi:hypothetical protein